MYGLVNEAIRDLVVKEHGEAAWARIAARAGAQTHSFVSMCPYDDGVTYKLVAAVSKELGAPANAVLEKFGEHWIGFTAERGYGNLLELCGRSFAEFLEQLDSIHARMKLAFPKLDPPIIVSTRLAPGLVRLDYSSRREGLAPMMVGLLRGLGRRFGIAVEIEQTETRAEHGADRFLIRYEESQP